MDGPRERWTRFTGDLTGKVVPAMQHPMTAEQALARIRESVEIAREVEQETDDGNLAAQVGVLRYLLTSAERVLAQTEGGPA